MTYTFNLIEQEWIPCLDQGGISRLYSIGQALTQAHRLQSIAGDSPLETASLYRLLLAVLHSALRGPESASAWYELWQAGSWDAPWLHSYLDRWRHRFDLFDAEHPFYQARDERVKPKSIISLAMDMVSGNNAALFDHHTEEVPTMLDAPKAARVLITAQTFGLGGLSGLKEDKFTDAPWGRGVVFLLEGGTLFETLCLNLLRYNEDNPTDFSIIGDDMPAWEMESPYLPERKVPHGYLDYLTWQNRRILLFPEGDSSNPVVGQMTVAPGLRLEANKLDPFKHYRKDENRGYLVMRFNEGRALWRDNAALFQLHKPEQIRPPLNFNWAARLVDETYLERRRPLSYMALGMANDQAKVEFFRHEHMPLPLVYLEREDLVGQLANALSKAEEVYIALRNASQWMAVLLISPSSDGKKWNEVSKITQEEANELCFHWSIDQFYWGALELPFLDLLAKLPASSEEAVHEWNEILIKTAREALEQAAQQAGESATALKAAVSARAHLYRDLKNNNLFPQPEKEATA
jgi:CRISPR system Cascade subunit CasA